MEALKGQLLPADGPPGRPGQHPGALEIDRGGDRAYLRGRALTLRPKEFLLLALLAEHAGQWVPMTAVVSALGCDGCFPRKTIVVHLCRVRAALGDQAGARIIQSERRLGYRLDPAALAAAP
ncbi:MAG: winged helix-turn-helix domain-containing protein [Gammaproteobacteria bacterium]